MLNKAIISSLLLLSTHALLVPTTVYAQTAACSQTAPITESEITAVQTAWANGIVAIGDAYLKKHDYKTIATQLIDHLYAYDEGSVLFKPTKAAKDEFRETKAQALSYFIGGEEPEDHGFALKPWSNVRFKNNQISLNGDTAQTMGVYYFTDAHTQQETKVEYTFGYKRSKEGNLLIYLHHSSLPYEPPAAEHH